MTENTRIKPRDIKFDEPITEICCHPLNDVIATGEITGEISLHSYSTEADNHLLLTLPHHKKSCRGLKFSKNGDTLFTASKDASLCTVDVNTGAVIHTQTDAHSEPIYCMCLVGDHMLATGDDEGNVKLWDLRSYTEVMSDKQNDDYISDMTAEGNAKTLLCTSGDGSLTVYNLKKRRMQMQSEVCTSELLSLAVMKNCSKVVCGTGNKAIHIFNWGDWNDLSDRFPGFKGSVECLVPINNDIICTGSSAGIIRAVNIVPNRFLGVIGKHQDFPIERLSLTHDKRFVTSCSHDQIVKFWDLSQIDNSNVGPAAKQLMKDKYRDYNAKKEDNFFCDLSDSGDKIDDENKNENSDNNNDDDGSEESELSDESDDDLNEDLTSNDDDLKADSGDIKTDKNKDNNDNNDNDESKEGDDESDDDLNEDLSSGDNDGNYSSEESFDDGDNES